MSEAGRESGDGGRRGGRKDCEVRERRGVRKGREKFEKGRHRKRDE